MVQGWRVSGSETSVEIPKRLVGYLEANTTLDATLHDTGHGSYILSGAAVTDAETLSQMDIPGHETCVEVGKVRKGNTDGIDTG